MHEAVGVFLEVRGYCECYKLKSLIFFGTAGLKMIYRPIFMLLAVVLSAAASVEAQTVSLKGNVSETVALSVLPDFTHPNIDVNVMSSGSTVHVTLSSDDAKAPVIRVPLLVRSNSSFKISAAVESTTAELAQLSVVDVSATGQLVSPAAISGLTISPQLDSMLSGPRISLGGTLTSPNNALKVTLLIRMKPQAVRGWLVHLTLVGTAAPLIP